MLLGETQESLKRERPGLRLRLPSSLPPRRSKMREGRNGEEEEEEDEDADRRARRASASPIFKQETCTMPHGVVRLPTIMIPRSMIKHCTNDAKQAIKQWYVGFTGTSIHPGYSN